MSLYEFGPFQLDAEQLLLLHDGVPVALGPKVVETLLALIEHPGEVLSKAALLDRIWPEGFVEEANLAQNIYVLRKAFKTQWSADAIETVPRRGYRFVEPVKLVERLAALPVIETPAAAPAVLSEPAKRHRRAPRFVYAFASVVVLAILAGGIVLASVFGQRSSGPVQLSAAGARLYAIGRYYWNLRTPAGVEKSLSYFTEVVDSDPRAAAGYAALADANAMMGDYHYGHLTSAVYLTRAGAYAQKALALDPASGAAYAALGFIALRNSNWKAALRQLHHAVALDPSDGPAHEWYGIALLQTGRLTDSFRELRTAADLDPLSVATTAWLGDAAYLDHRYDEAIAYSRQTLDLAPGRFGVYQTIGLAYEARGNYAEAITAFKHFGAACKDCHGEAAALLANVYAQTHHLRLARKELAFALAHPKYLDAGDVAVALSAIGQRTVALSWLRRVHGTMNWTAIANDTRFDRLRADAGFRHVAQAPA